jgi:hypothetical protein
MEWETPVFQEIPMNAEIGGYQLDGGKPLGTASRQRLASLRSARPMEDPPKLEEDE